MNNANSFKFDDLQALVRFGHKELTDTCFLLLNVSDVDAAKHWLQYTRFSHAGESSAPDKALQIAFSVEGLRVLGVEKTVVEEFSDEFILGMSSSEDRSRRLGDIGNNAPENWTWGGNPVQVPHILLLLYAKDKGIVSWRKKVESNGFAQAFQLLKELPTQYIGDIEPFGFKDGISQPEIDWENQQSTDQHDRDRFSNLVAVGEVVLGYPNEYGLYTERPLIDPKKDKCAEQLPNALDKPIMKDFGRNGSYLVLRQLGQDVPGFWQFLNKASDPEQENSGNLSKKTQELATSMVGRKRDGSPLIPNAVKPIPGISRQDDENHFNYDFDPDGNKCPIGAHIRRSNPRTGDLPPRSSGLFTRLIKILGFGDQDEDLVASTRFHRLLRRGRSYGPELTPENAVKPSAEVAERGLQFICLAANILRQFEFVQNAWTMSSKFSGLQQESDPLLGNREPLLSGESVDQFNQPIPGGPVQKTCHLPQFVTVQGGAYFFMPGLRALEYIATIPNKEDTDS